MPLWIRRARVTLVSAAAAGSLLGQFEKDACLFHSFRRFAVRMALPEDAWRVVAGHVETERELCALACTSRELRRVLEDDDVWRRVFERRFELRFVNEHERRRGREATADEPDDDDRVSGLVSSSPVAGSIPRGAERASRLAGSRFEASS